MVTHRVTHSTFLPHWAGSIHRGSSRWWQPSHIVIIVKQAPTANDRRRGVTGLMGYVRSWPAPIGGSVGSESYRDSAAALRRLSALVLLAIACLPFPVLAQGVPAPSQVAPPVI